MISFIIIGRNEGFKLTNCLISVYETIKKNDVKDYEVLYIDSQSTDDSIERVQKFTEVRIFKITGRYNAAIARNIGAIESKGEILFLIDGDVELLPEFLQKVIEVNGNLKYNCVSGHVDNIIYDREGRLVGRIPGSYRGPSLPLHKKVVKTNGGIFIIKRTIWNAVNGIRTKYRINEDLDLTLRLSKKGIKSIRIPDMMALHHTIDYRNSGRMWQMIINGDVLYPAVLLRDHLFFFDKIKHTLRKQYTTVLLLLSLTSLALNYGLFIFFSTLWGLMVLLKTYFNVKNNINPGKSKMVYYFERIAYQVVNDALFWLAFFFFYPEEKVLKYTKIT